MQAASDVDNRAIMGPLKRPCRRICARVSNGPHDLDNRGPIRFHADGRVHTDILDAYWKYGFYVFEGVLKQEELNDIEADLFDIIERLPTERGSAVDAQGRPALGADCEARTLFWSKPLGDPFGGTDLANGRHPVKMLEPTPACRSAPGSGLSHYWLAYNFPKPASAPMPIRSSWPWQPPSTVRISCRSPMRYLSKSRAKGPRSPGIRMARRTGTVRPGTREPMALTSWPSSTVAPRQTAYGSCRERIKSRHIDITQRVAEAGSERLPDAVPMVCKSGRCGYLQPAIAALFVCQYQPGLARHSKLWLSSPCVRAGGERRRSA